MTRTITAAELRRQSGSHAAHERLQEAVLTYFRLNGVPALPVNTGPRVRPREGGGYELRGNRAQVGMADVLACVPPLGRLLLVEIKSGQAKRSPAQVELHDRFAAAGAVCLVVRDVRELEPHVGTSRTKFGAGERGAPEASSQGTGHATAESTGRVPRPKPGGPPRSTNGGRA